MIPCFLQRLSLFILPQQLQVTAEKIHIHNWVDKL
uniref:Uncharacterized protein n=1 Tax=Anguilla anguilla TaxID=7936 RepID=A0A0E9TS49_ANGAN